MTTSSESTALADSPIELPLDATKLLRCRRLPHRLKIGQSFPRRRLSRFHHVDERVEQIRRVMRAGAGFGVILHAKDRQRAMAESFDGVVVEIQMRHHAAFGFQRFSLDRKTMVLAGDFHATGIQILYRLISAAMAEFQLECVGSDRPSQQLVPKADAENWHFAQ